jgi:hypothetical protein
VTKLTVLLAKQLPMTQAVSNLKTYLQKFMMGEQTVNAQWCLFNDHL